MPHSGALPVGSVRRCWWDTPVSLHRDVLSYFCRPRTRSVGSSSVQHHRVRFPPLTGTRLGPLTYPPNSYTRAHPLGYGQSHLPKPPLLRGHPPGPATLHRPTPHPSGHQARVHVPAGQPPHPAWVGCGPTPLSLLGGPVPARAWGSRCHPAEPGGHACAVCSAHLGAWNRLGRSSANHQGSKYSSFPSILLT